VTKIFTALLLFWSLNAFAQRADSTFVSNDSTRTLHEVVVTGVSDEQSMIRQKPVHVSVVQALPFYKTNLTGLDLLRQVSGIKIRLSGGFGARNDFFINGSTGKQVKFFIDGIPQDNLGETQLISVYPVEQIERMEVYKGVLPVDLGADALGAAVNIVTRTESENYFDASYSIASFNTHRLNASGKKYFGKHFFVGALGNVNYAGNNCRIQAEVPNEFGNLEVKTVKRFHDVYKNYIAKVQAGIVGTTYADRLVLGIVNTGMYDEIQTNLLQTASYGSAHYKERLLSGSLQYQKNNLLTRTDVSAYGSYSYVRGLFMDTSRNVYNWEGRIVDRKYGGGELSSSGHVLKLNTNVVNAKFTASHRLSDDLKLTFSNTYQQYRRTGRDTLAQEFYGGIDYYATPSSLIKNISGLGLEGSFINMRLKVSTALKNYSTWLSGYELEWQTQTVIDESLHAFAYNAAMGYQITDQIQLKTSYEHAARLPDVEEALGDLMLISPNPNIQIETSDNINLTSLMITGKLEAELTGFFRDVTNIIYLRTAPVGSQYQNLLSARVLGIEGNLRYRPVTSLSLNANITYQDLRNKSVIRDNGINNDRYKNARLPNIPYLFMNAGVSWKKHGLLGDDTMFQVWWNANYTHEYFLYWEVDGAPKLKNRIPDQLLHHAGVSYALSKLDISFALEVNNLADSKVYDNFKVQLPGRSVSLKARIYLAQQQN
jgi:outer membrane receptor protein involved in Fe transport